VTSNPTLKPVTVPLGIAAAHAYCELTPEHERVQSPDDLKKVLHGVAVALSALAPIFQHDEKAGTLVPLSASDIVTILFRQAGHEAWERLAIRQADLKAAITTLRQVRTAFGPLR
jgi:hypothetical protein